MRIAVAIQFVIQIRVGIKMQDIKIRKMFFIGLYDGQRHGMIAPQRQDPDLVVQQLLINVLDVPRTFMPFLSSRSPTS